MPSVDACYPFLEGRPGCPDRARNLVQTVAEFDFDEQFQHLARVVSDYRDESGRLIAPVADESFQQLVALDVQKQYVEAQVRRAGELAAESRQALPPADARRAIEGETVQPRARCRPPPAPPRCHA